MFTYHFNGFQHVIHVQGQTIQRPLSLFVKSVLEIRLDSHIIRSYGNTWYIWSYSVRPLNKHGFLSFQWFSTCDSYSGYSPMSLQDQHIIRVPPIPYDGLLPVTLYALTMVYTYHLNGVQHAIHVQGQTQDWQSHPGSANTSYGLSRYGPSPCITLYK